MIKAKIPEKFLVYWYINYLFPNIDKYVGMLGSLTKEKFMLCAQQPNIPHSPWLSTDPPKPTPSPHVDGVTGSISHSSIGQ